MGHKWIAPSLQQVATVAVRSEETMAFVAIIAAVQRLRPFSEQHVYCYFLLYASTKL